MAPRLPATPLQIELPLWSAGETTPAAGADDSLRRLLIGHDWLAYRLRRGNRRRLSLTVDADGLRIAAPLSLPLRAIEDFARANAAWILRKLDEWKKQPRRPSIEVADGIAFPLGGRPMLLRVVAGMRGAADWQPDQLQLPAATNLARSFERALRERARAQYLPRVAHFAARLGVDAPPVSIGAARTRWGSCSRAGIRLNWRLLHLREAIADYVIVHEVAHLREMNHGPRFWKIVGELCPDYRSLRAALRDEADALPVFR
jgi:hypothetical protein